MSSLTPSEVSALHPKCRSCDFFKSYTMANYALTYYCDLEVPSIEHHLDPDRDYCRYHTDVNVQQEGAHP